MATRLVARSSGSMEPYPRSALSTSGQLPPTGLYN